VHEGIRTGSRPEQRAVDADADSRRRSIRDPYQDAWRVIYVAKQADAVYVLHCFHKTTPKTPKADIDLAAKRYKLIGA